MNDFEGRFRAVMRAEAESVIPAHSRPPEGFLARLRMRRRLTALGVLATVALIASGSWIAAGGWGPRGSTDLVGLPPGCDSPDPGSADAEGPIELRFTTPRGEPLVGAAVAIHLGSPLPGDDPDRYQPFLIATGTTDEEGRFRFRMDDPVVEAAAGGSDKAVDTRINAIHLASGRLVTWGAVIPMRGNYEETIKLKFTLDDIPPADGPRSDCPWDYVVVGEVTNCSEGDCEQEDPEPLDCDDPDFFVGDLPLGWTDILQPGSGGTGDEAPGLIGHYGAEGRATAAKARLGFADLYSEAVFSPTNPSPVEMFGDETTVGDIHEGFAITFTVEDCSYQLVGYGMTRSEFVQFATSLRRE